VLRAAVSIVLHIEEQTDLFPLEVAPDVLEPFDDDPRVFL
jgi:hypothetical protein